MSNTPNSVGIAYSFVSWLNNFDELKPSIDLNVYHFNEGPNVPVKKPVIFMIHGGAWVLGDKNQYDAYKPKFFNELGCIYVSINYRLSRPFGITTAWVASGNDDYVSWDVNRVKHPTHIKDVANALKWVRDNIQDYGGDPDRIAVFGHSAGAHLATLLCTNTSYINNVGIATSCIRACVSLDSAGLNAFDGLVDSNPETVVMTKNAFGVPYDSGRAFNDFSSTAQQNEIYTDGSPTLFVSSGIVTEFLMCTRGTSERRQIAIDFIDSLEPFGIGRSLCLYIGVNTYDHEQIQEYIGDPRLIPPGNSLPTPSQIANGAATVDISTFITTHLKRIGFV